MRSGTSRPGERDTCAPQAAALGAYKPEIAERLSSEAGGQRGMPSAL